MNLYATADKVGIATGGGLVTRHELSALRTIGECKVLSRDELVGGSDPWGWDQIAVGELSRMQECPKLTHLYAGSFGKSVKKLKDGGSKVCYTVAAHDKEVSRREHEKFGVPFSKLYPHLCEKEQFEKYVEGYRLADVIVAPSRAAERSIRAYGGEFETKRIEIIPHGCELPEVVKPIPKQFVVGAMGAIGGPDKGLIYLLQAWKKLDYSDAVLVLAGKDSTSPHVFELVDKFGGGTVVHKGWVKDEADFYNGISILCQPSATEGFGIEVAEALAHSRRVICSDGAGAADCVADGGVGIVVPACNVDSLATAIDCFKRIGQDGIATKSEQCRRFAETLTWDKIRQRYVDLWKEMLI